MFVKIIPSRGGTSARPPAPRAQVPGAWECEYCRALTVVERDRCCECGAPRRPNMRRPFFEPSFVETPADRPHDFGQHEVES